ncbi:hypothetical protein [Arenimonas sp. GDDSR-1]|uniref:hypothetical protein n=1 Tax=Arenimonas sp. GDDSR-1 TaxID=2950125 RepID=UPI00262F1022|nr:hypothetical protein [Arenimonas sp. GDDSR-1]
MTGTEHDSLIRDIRQVLDANPPDADSRRALQLARAKALTPEAKRAWRLPWLEVAVSASLVAVLAVTLPRPPAAVKAPQPVAAAGKPAPAATATATAAKPAVKAAPETAAADADLLENLELYEDAEFYQWLSEQDGEGVHDA